ncbi:hypothetical protein OIU74_003001 [Salix koriyanagi]|uniref:Protein kinase domain-containing protein n=1 Tax=Salix koriyanagi TaxID=2511006 RepID=A0A9Q0UYC8_9ROSI|nr:hypothetical protein OIU74_003001 [Salix koriyanagi]
MELNPLTSNKVPRCAQKASSKRKNINQVFTFRELAVATSNFNHHFLVGEGGFGRVYKGYIDSVDQMVAVKKLDRKGLQGNREFFSEVLTLSMVKHLNLVKLIGYCADGDQRLLVYEFMANGSLENHLLGRRAIDRSRPTEEQNLIHWAAPLLMDRSKFTEMADPLLEGNYPKKSLYQALAIASMCVHEEADARPLMADVVTAFEFLTTPAGEEKPTMASTESIHYVESVKGGNAKDELEA